MVETVKRKMDEAFSPLRSSQDCVNQHTTHAQGPDSDAHFDLATPSSNDVGQTLSANSPNHQPTQGLECAPLEQREAMLSMNVPNSCRPDRTDDDPLSKAKMWDPVKDCNDPDPSQDQVIGFRSVYHNNSEQFIDPTLEGSTSKGLQSPHGDHPHTRPQISRQHINSIATETASTSLRLNRHPYDAASGYKGKAAMGLYPYHQSHGMDSGYEGTFSTGLQPFQTGFPFDQPHRSLQYPTQYESASTLSSKHRDPFGQLGQHSSESMTRGAAVMGMQPLPIGNFNKSAHENSQQSLSTESGLFASMVPQGPAAQQSSLSMTSHPLAQGSSYAHQTHRPDFQTISLDLDRAFSMAHYAEKLDQDSNYAAAIPAYEQACTLFQEMLVRSCSFEERTRCNDAVSL